MMQKLDEFTQGYLEAALWSSLDETNPEQGGEPLEDNYGFEDIEFLTLHDMIRDCRIFQVACADLINDDNDLHASSEHSCDARAGHDFWLTRNGHGCGFWDGDWAEPAATKFDDLSKAFGEYNITASGKGGKVEKM